MRGMENAEGGDGETTMLWGNLATAIAYYVITSQLLLFVCNPKVCNAIITADIFFEIIQLAFDASFFFRW